MFRRQNANTQGRTQAGTNHQTAKSAIKANKRLSGIDVKSIPAPRVSHS